MTTHDERQRLAAMGNALRPDWPLNSLYTLLTGETVVKRAYRDVALALAWIATDPDTRTPARIHEPGPWWTRGETKRIPVVNVIARQTCCGGLHAPNAPCDPPEHERSHGRGAAAARAALRGDQRTHTWGDA